MYYRCWLPLIKNINGTDVIVFVQNIMLGPLERLIGDTLSISYNTVSQTEARIKI